MGKGLGLYFNIGKKTIDLLNKDYNFILKFSFISYTSNGLAFTSTDIKKGEFFLRDLNTQRKN